MLLCLSKRDHNHKIHYSMHDIWRKRSENPLKRTIMHNGHYIFNMFCFIFSSSVEPEAGGASVRFAVGQPGYPDVWVETVLPSCWPDLVAGQRPGHRRRRTTRDVQSRKTGRVSTYFHVHLTHFHNTMLSEINVRCRSVIYTFFGPI